ncbi:hypothetical protein [Kurthia sibirica]|uniref:hypothetical protein n=1 Tax=Kurthia sibirica TaxID=202750 RepID=UPI001168EDAD|nr:hypothetical protein [Kurthia sibirica]GEK33031.1 hypothetical protein KSI01_05640 [Kurthia sibirica]
MKLKYNLYFLFIIASGLVYSYTTTIVAQSVLENKLIILALSAVISLLIFVDLQKLHLLSRISLNSFFYLGIILCGIIAAISLFSTNAYTYVIFYFFINIIISVVILLFENEILTEELNLSNGFLNLASVRNLAKLFGFAIGALLINVPSYYFIAFILLIFSTSVLLLKEKFVLRKHVEEKKLDSRFKNLNKKRYFVILGVLATTTTIWIPIFVNDFIQEDMQKLSFVPFVLPGIAIFIVLELVKRNILSTIFKKPIAVYLIVSLLFMLYLLYIPFVWVGVILFSLLTAIGILVSIDLRKTFLEANVAIDSKFVLQSLYLNGAIFLLIFSSIYKYLEVLQFVIIILNSISMIYLMRERVKLNMSNSRATVE